MDAYCESSYFGGVFDSKFDDTFSCDIFGSVSTALDTDKAGYAKPTGVYRVAEIRVL